MIVSEATCRHWLAITTRTVPAVAPAWCARSHTNHRVRDKLAAASFVPGAVLFQGREPTPTLSLSSSTSRGYKGFKCAVGGTISLLDGMFCPDPDSKNEQNWVSGHVHAPA